MPFDNADESDLYRREVNEEYAEILPLATALRTQIQSLKPELSDTDTAVRIGASQTLEELGASWRRWQARVASLPPGPRTGGPISGQLTRAAREDVVISPALRTKGGLAAQPLV